MISKRLKNFDFGQMKMQRLMSDAVIVTQTYPKNLVAGMGNVKKPQNRAFVTMASLETDAR